MPRNIKLASSSLLFQKKTISELFRLIRNLIVMTVSSNCVRIHERDAKEAKATLHRAVLLKCSGPGFRSPKGKKLSCFAQDEAQSIHILVTRALELTGMDDKC
ncbi:uncharacterized protein TrAtP1_008608 [Trichoderma atroviride]|uniref:uncharacterized protein n=1 Tax=Hypocrea atroviridis TaxID=63577 RepID=UPI0033298302|nr:hypothetical protein TrAtP1_008608 [Trichoderma atroviride]